MRCFADTGVILEVELPGKAEGVPWRITCGGGGKGWLGGRMLILCSSGGIDVWQTF